MDVQQKKVKHLKFTIKLLVSLDRWWLALREASITIML